MSVENKRAAPRVETEVVLRFETVDQLALAYGTEMSTGGMFLATNEVASPGAELRVLLVLPESTATITIRARVVHARSTAEADQAGLPAGMGIRFLNLDGPTRAKIEAFVGERMGAPESQTSRPATRQGVSILVVEDDPTYQQLIAAAFSSDDAVRFAMNGFEALALCGREIPDVIVSDVNMPKMDGWQLVRLLRSKSQYASIPLLFTTTLLRRRRRLLRRSSRSLANFAGVFQELTHVPGRSPSRGPPYWKSVVLRRKALGDAA